MRYLLGELSENEQGRVEERFFSDDQFYQEVRAAERDLIDDYVKGKLAGRERERFDAHFMKSPSRRQKVELAMSFNRFVSEAPKEAMGREPRLWWQPLFEFTGMGQASVRFAATAAALILAVSFFWLLFETARLRTQVGQMRAGQAEQEKLEQQLAEEQARLAELNSELERERARSAELEQQTGSDDQSQSAIASGLLTPDAARRLVNPPSGISSLIVPMSSTVMGQGKTFNVISPVATFVQQERPMFEWQAVAGASRYEVRFSSHDMPTSQAISANRWQVEYPLTRGEVYTWHVVAFAGDQEIARSVEAKFKVIDRAKADQVERAKKRYAGSPLNLGIVYAQAGLLDEAEREFRRVLESRHKSPDAEKLVGRLLDSVRESRKQKPGFDVPR